MAHADDEQSVQDSLISELYEFSANGTVVARRTSREIAVVYGGQTYSPITGGIRRNPLAQASIDDPGELIVELPVTDAFVTSYAFSAPPRSLTCTMRRHQAVSGEAPIVWQGAVANFAVSGRVCKIRVPSKIARVESMQIPTRAFQFSCPHALYDENCQVAAASFDVATTVSSISGLEVTVASDGGNPDGWFRLGQVVRASDGERRWITRHVGNVITLHAAFRTLAASDSITLYAGCDKTPKTCRDKFANIENFGGHPDVPTVNPWSIYGITFGA